MAKRRRDRSRRLNTLQIKQLQDGKEIYNALLNANDPQAFQVHISTMIGVIMYVMVTNPK